MSRNNMRAHNRIIGRKKAHPFYSYGKWLAVRDAYLHSKHYVCELCGQPAKYVHHKDPLQDEDYFVNYEKCYGFANLQALCMDCHNRQPGHFLDGKGKQLVADGYRVNMITGELEVIPPQAPKSFGAEKAVSSPYEKLDEDTQRRGSFAK